MNEFSLIQTFFNDSSKPHIALNQQLAHQKKIALGIGDDAAVFSLEHNQQLVSSHDTLLEGVHFPKDCSAADIAYKALAVNLSDLAAMGAQPHSFTLSLALPLLDEYWLKEFSESLFNFANQTKLCLIGGDTVKGSLAISIQINGIVDSGKFLKRSGLQPGDNICVTGSLGLAALGLQRWQSADKSSFLGSDSIARFLRPEPRHEFASFLFDSGARACIDISDGFIADLTHMLKASGVSAEINWENFLIHPELQKLPLQQQQALVFSGGDDYELCFSMSDQDLEKVSLISRENEIPFRVVGRVLAPALHLVMNPAGEEIKVTEGYNHFIEQPDLKGS